MDIERPKARHRTGRGVSVGVFVFHGLPLRGGRPVGALESLGRRRVSHMKTEDWESYVAFIRLDFPPQQRDIAQRLAVVFAQVVGREIARLRPDHTLVEVLGWRGADSLDTVEFIMALEQECGFEIGDDFAASSSNKTFRDLVEHVSHRTIAA